MAVNKSGAAARPQIKRGFVFKSVFGSEKNLTRELIELTLGTRISSIEMLQPEREFKVLANARAGSVDVYVVDEEGNRYDVEIQAESGDDEVMRARHYQSLMDATQLRTGTEAQELRGSVVIFICDFDPVGRGLRLYDCRTTCLQTGDVIADGRRLVLLNSRGEGDDVPESLAAFLDMVAGKEVSGDPFCDRVKAIIDSRIADPKWLEAYMTLEEEMEIAKYNAERRGYAEGEKTAAMKIAVGLVRDGVLSLAEAAARVGVDPAELTVELGDMWG